MSEVLSIDQFVSGFAEFAPGSETFVDIGGQDPLALKVSPSSDLGTKSLIVLFHGALGRSKGAKVPSFLNIRKALSGHAHQISLADPGVEPGNRVGVGWFAGSERNPVQKLLPPFFEKLKSVLGIERMIFVGSSGGGYGALFYSWHLPGSIVCASVPQTSAWAYNESNLRFYLEDCWPQGIQAYSEPPVLDLSDLYSKAVPNTVVYIQSSLDYRHLHKHMIPFMNSIRLEDRERVAQKVSFWGRPGHSGSVPPGELDGWIRSVISAPEITAESIIMQYQKSGIETTPLSHAMMKEAGALSRGSKAESGHRPPERKYQDLAWANLVYKAHRKEGV